MRLSRANIPLASEDRTHSQVIWTSPHNNLAPHFRPGSINLQHFCHSRWRNPVRLSKSGLGNRKHGLSRGARVGRLYLVSKLRTQAIFCSLLSAHSAWAYPRNFAKGPNGLSIPIFAP